jgi:hypothetical protein
VENLKHISWSEEYKHYDSPNVAAALLLVLVARKEALLWTMAGARGQLSFRS